MTFTGNCESKPRDGVVKLTFLAPRAIDFEILCYGRMGKDVGAPFDREQGWAEV